MASPWLETTASSFIDLGRPITFAEWANLPEDEPGELVDGRLEEEEVPDAIHELGVSWLIALLRSWLGGQGFVLGSGVKLAVSSSRGRKADVVVFFPGRAAPARRGPLRDPPDLLIEVVTPTPRDERRDRLEKMNEYASFGVKNYWLLDPALGTFEVFLLEDGRYTKALGLTAGRIAEVPGCPGLTLDLDALWAELERLAPPPEAAPVY
jgi:Uma2 family endonuclease